MSGFASIGECMIELSGADGDRWRMGFAGDTLNTTWYVRALTNADYPIDYVSAFGDDPFSLKQRQFLSDNSIGIAHSPVIAGAKPGIYAISLDGAERSFTYWRSEAAARQLASNPAALEASLAGRDIVYLSGITLAILTPENRTTLLRAVNAARKAGARIAFDPNYRARLWENQNIARTALEAAMRMADIALPTFPDEQELFGDATPGATATRLTSYGVSEIVVKDGTDPALVIADGKKFNVEAAKAAAVDTTGAGDSFNGAYLAARLKTIPPEQAAHRAHRVAARVVEIHGALAPMDEARKAFIA